MNKKEYDQGYEDAKKHIQDILKGNGESQSGDDNGQSNDLDTDLSGTPAGDKQKEQSNGQDTSGRGNGSQQNGQSNRGSGDQGQVTPQDCTGQYGENTPKTPGGFMDVDEGNKLAKEEGYEQAPSTDSISNSWKDVAVQAAQKAQGKNAGSLVSKILGIWKTTTDWKKSFRKIIGHSLNTQDKRQAYANKNILATQDRVARTDKDKYDCIDYMCIFTDSSGSVSDQDLQYMLSEIYQIAYQLKPETLVVGQFDTKITDVRIFNSPAEFKKYSMHATVKGRGGTECKCIWDLLKTDKRFKNHSAELVIIMTDGYLTQYKRDPKKMNNLCWCIIDNAGCKIEHNDAKTTMIHLDSSKIKH